MDTTQQTRLTKAEWDSVEVPVTDSEKRVLKLIIDGYSDVNIKHNDSKSLLNYAKIEKSDMIEIYFYNKFFQPIVTEIIKTTKTKAPEIVGFIVKEAKGTKLKTADTIRITNMTANIETMQSTIIEFIYLGFVKEMLTLFNTEKMRYTFYLYSLIQLQNIQVANINKHVLDFITICLDYVKSKPVLTNVLYNAYECIEKNPNIYKYGDISLYDHQKRLFSLFRKSHEEQYNACSKLVLYIAPTGTGKTLSPIGLVKNHRVIFVCAARHVGLALAKSAISAQKCVAFAFGCETASDIRLHNFAASVYKINKRSGGIGKIDNTVGNKVELMICDAKSYLVAMYYMMSFNDKHRIITYWDEPTIGLDCENHVLHQTIHRNWSENEIPNIVLSSATLPNATELMPMIMDFRRKFIITPEVTTIQSFDFNKSISVINKMGFCVCPHNMFENYRDMQECIDYCNENQTLLRYFDLNEIIKFIVYLKESRFIPEHLVPETYFENNVAKIKMNSIKKYYLELMQNIEDDAWPTIYRYVKTMMKPKFDKTPENVFKKSTSLNGNTSAVSGKPLARTSSVSTEPTFIEKAKANSIASGGILLTTADANTLTDGPTIYLTESISTISNFYIQQSNIPKKVFDEMMHKIGFNNAILEKIAKLEAKLEDELKGVEVKDKTNMNIDDLKTTSADRIDRQIEELKTQFITISLDSVYVPNTTEHQNIWVPKIVENAFIPTINSDITKRVMELEIDDRLKILLLLGIGSFEYQDNTTYTEIVKEMANQKRLFMIIASSDYIYGTNYQFCHEVIGKDLVNMSQQKTIQALGRVGRNNIQQDYTARFRDDAIIYNLFKPITENIEAVNMCKLLVTDDE
jgi:hypothetical protein